jgi:5-formyltetrahydrofolate cyclo-ligase
MVCEFNNSVCITPGICFDKYGYRIGYGKGFYDKFFYNHDVFKIGLCYQECLVDKIEVDDYDIAVDKIITD